jgi:hypothetical protein
MSETLIDDRAGAGADDTDPEAEVAGSGDLGEDGAGAHAAEPGRIVSSWNRFISMPIEGWITLAVITACVTFVFYQLGPSNIFTNNTPAGGDMGAHVWGPAFLRDHLLTQGRLSGWTPDWYAGFPAYTFYMILPSLAIALLSYVIPYGIAFKLIAISGVLTLPIAAWAFGRLTRLPFPTPALLAVGATAYLFDRSFSIYGGNIASTLAGEFAFSISLSFALLFLGVLARGLETGKYRAWAAALFALTALCHLIPVFFAVAGTAVLFALQIDWSRVRWWVWGALAGSSLGFAALAAYGSASGGIFAPMASDASVWSTDGIKRILSPPTLGIAFVVFAALVTATAVVLALSQRPRLWPQVKYLATVLPVGAAITAFWTGPFYLRSGYMTDMGWEKLTNYSDSLFARTHLAQQLSDRPGIQYLLILGAVGTLMALAYRRRGTIFWVVMAAVAGIAFLYVPQSRLWNARLLPFYYLAIYLVGAAGIAEVGRTIGRIVAADPRRPPRLALWLTAAIGLGAWLIVLGLPLHSLPFGQLKADGTYSWGPLSTKDSSFVTSWANWNFTGYEGKASYPEYYAVTKTMEDVGQQHGCGRAMWEYSDNLNNYGTPMALMLLPFWTNGCIGSMEGLYFEASATTPYHFLNQSELSTSPSEAERDLPYRATALSQQDFDLGVEHLQMLGVRYYMASTSQTIAYAASNPSLTRIASSGPWVVYQVSDSSLVVPLKNQPAVVDGASQAGKTWLNDTVSWYIDPTQWKVLLAASGPSSWQRVKAGVLPGQRPVGGTTSVSNIKSGTDTISFDVSKVGVPVEVKASYFPNWKASGADGPYRVSPNLMVVIPRSKHVSLYYGYTGVDYGSYLLTLLGLIGLILLWRAKPVSMPPVPAMWRTDGDPIDELDVDDPRDPEWWIDPLDPQSRPGAPPPYVPMGTTRSDSSGSDPPGSDPPGAPVTLEPVVGPPGEGARDPGSPDAGAVRADTADGHPVSSAGPHERVPASEADPAAIIAGLLPPPPKGPDS